MLDSSQLLSNIGDLVSKAPVVGAVAKNPFYTAVLICLILVLITIVVFRNVDTGDEPKWKLAMRVGVYSLIFVTAIQFLQNQYVFSVCNAKTGAERTAEVFENKHVGGFDEKVHVKPQVRSSDTVQMRNQTSAQPTSNNEIFTPVGIDVSFI